MEKEYSLWQRQVDADQDSYTPDFSRFELEMLFKFEHMTRTVRKVMDDLKNGQDNNLVEIDKMTDRKTTVLPLDAHFVNTWFRVITSEYMEYFKGNPEMELAASMLCSGVKERREKEREEEVQRLNDLWNAE